MFKSIKIGAGSTGVRVVGVEKGRETLPRALPGVSDDGRAALATALRRPDFQGESGETAAADDEHLLLGLGDKDGPRLDALRSAGAGLVRRLDRMSARRAVLVPVADLTGDRSGIGQMIAEGAALANWRVDFFDGTAAETPDALPPLTLDCPDASMRSGARRGLALADSANYARRLAATPPNVCHPGWIASEARRLARGTGLRCRVIDFARAKELGLGGLVNVGQASARKPCMVVLEHRPRRIAAAARDVRLVLVGKTITYDTGGYSMKSPANMKGMKYDKCGGTAVLGAMRAIAELDVPVRVWGLLPAAENMVGGDAYRPDDIITLYNGVTVEVTNTDAEGRLVLADALAWACRQLKPTAVIDAATLTGGVVVALGAWCAGLFCNDAELRRRLDTAAEASGERWWRLPLWKEHRQFMRARHADIWNSGPKRDGHPIQGAAFLSYFVDEQVPWAHLDIAGVASVDGDGDLYAQGPTGFGVRLLTEVAEGYGKKGTKARRHGGT